jgi:hypothetical protein
MSFTLLGILNSQALGAAAGGAFDHLQTITVTGSPADVQFQSVDEYASDYKHLQIRFEARSSRTGNSADSLFLQLGTGDVVDTGSNYSTHYLRAAAAAKTSAGVSTTTAINLNNNAAADYTSDAWTIGILDIYDAFNANKYPTVKCFTGQTFNEDSLYLSSGSWRNTGTISDILFTHQISSPAVGSRYSIYGMRG